MNIEELRDFCLTLPFVEEKFPFDESTLVFYIGGKMFALCNLEAANSVNLKCNPERAIELRERYVGIIPGWHMNKKHWNTIHLVSDVPEQLLHEMICDSYHLVVDKLPKKERLKYIK